MISDIFIGLIALIVHSLALSIGRSVSMSLNQAHNPWTLKD